MLSVAVRHRVVTRLSTPAGKAAVHTDLSRQSLPGETITRRRLPATGTHRRRVKLHRPSRQPGRGRLLNTGEAEPARRSNAVSKEGAPVPSRSGRRLGSWSAADDDDAGAQPPGSITEARSYLNTGSPSHRSCTAGGDAISRTVRRTDRRHSRRNGSAPRRKR